jgi:hypothetical protein
VAPRRSTFPAVSAVPATDDAGASLVANAIAKPPRPTGVKAIGRSCAEPIDGWRMAASGNGSSGERQRGLGGLAARAEC